MPDYRHKSVYQDRARKPAQSLDEALKRLGHTVATRAKDQMARRYPAKGTKHTRLIGLRMLGEKDD